MKRKAVKKDSNEEVTSQASSPNEDELSRELTDALSIEEFIKIRQLQNQILEKMLEKIRQPESKEINKKRNK